MALTDGSLSAADLAAVIGNNNDGSFGNNGAWWLLILLLVFGNGWGNNNGYGNGGNGGGGYIVSDVQRGFDQSAIMSALSGITASLSSAEVSRCNGQTNILAGINSLGQNLSTQLNTIAMNQQSCCCNTRETVQSGVQSILTGMTNGFQNLSTQMSSGIQTILDKLCQQEIDALKTQLANANTQLNLANLRESQTAQTATILANNAAQTAALEQYLNPPAVPAYIVQNPNCCSGNSVYSSCGCGAA